MAETTTPGTRRGSAGDDPPADGARPGDGGVDLDGDGAVGSHREPVVPWWAAALVAVVVGVAGIGLGRGLAQPARPARDSVDVGFLQDMLLVYDQVAQVASEQVARASTPGAQTDPAIAESARSTARHALGRIGLFEGRLADLGFTRADRPGLSRAWMGRDQACEVQPGIADEVTLTKWRRATGTEADARYVAVMIPLQSQAAPMAQVAAGRAADPKIRELAAVTAQEQQAAARTLGTLRDRKGLPDLIAR